MSIQGIVTAWRAGKYDLRRLGELLDVTLSMVTAWRAGKYNLDCVIYWTSIQGMVTA